MNQANREFKLRDDSLAEELSLQAKTLTQKREILQITADLTETNYKNLVQFSVFQVGNYQFWRDRHSIAVVDAKERRLIAFGDTEADFYPQSIELPEILQRSLMAEIDKVNPNLNLTCERQDIERANEQILPLDPIARSEEILYQPKKSLGSKFKGVLGKVHQMIDRLPIADTKRRLKRKLKQQYENYHDRTKIILLELLGKQLARCSLAKFNSAHAKTGEDTYRFGNFYLQRREKNFELANSQNQVIAIFKASKKGITLTKVNDSLSSIRKALQSIEREPAIGSKRLAGEYRAKVKEIITRLQKFYDDGKHYFEDGSAYLIKEKGKLILKDKQNNLLLQINKCDCLSQLSAKQIDTLNREIDRNCLLAIQQERITRASQIVFSYLNLCSKQRMTGRNSRIEFDPKTKILSYQDLNDRKNYFKAKRDRKGNWHITDAKSHLSKKKERDFDKMKLNVETYQQRKKKAMGFAR